MLDFIGTLGVPNAARAQASSIEEGGSSFPMMTSVLLGLHRPGLQHFILTMEGRVLTWCRMPGSFQIEGPRKC